MFYNLKFNIVFFYHFELQLNTASIKHFLYKESEVLIWQQILAL